jgi:hypothetical protein
MRNYTLEYLKKLVQPMPKLAGDRRPRPMPGKKYPTHVGWYMHVASWQELPNGHIKYFQPRVLRYVGKPNRYRALEARKLLQEARKPKTLLMEMWQAEFDRDGLVAYVLYRHGKQRVQQASGAFSAYHPHSSQPEIVEAFSKPLHLKYIGGQRLYSQKAKLSADAVEAYYEWFGKQFKKKLRRPRAIGVALVAGKPMQDEAQEADSVE